MMPHDPGEGVMAWGEIPVRRAAGRAGAGSCSSHMLQRRRYLGVQVLKELVDPYDGDYVGSHFVQHPVRT